MYMRKQRVLIARSAAVPKAVYYLFVDLAVHVYSLCIVNSDGNYRCSNVSGSARILAYGLLLPCIINTDGSYRCTVGMSTVTPPI